MTSPLYQKMGLGHKIWHRPDSREPASSSIDGKQVNFWRTVETSVNSMNYFTDGTISDNYFVVEGYVKNYKNR